MAIDTTTPRTRRAILLGALGATAASVAAAVGRATPASAIDGEPLLLGHAYTATHSTEVGTGDTGQVAFAGHSNAELGVGIHGTSLLGTGVVGASTSGTAMIGNSGATNKPAVIGHSRGDFTGVQGFSGPPVTPPAREKTGVYGSASQDAKAVGVRGESSLGRGGVFGGKVAQLKLTPASVATHPASGQMGDFFVDNNGRLWFCKGGKYWKLVA